MNTVRPIRAVALVAVLALAAGSVLMPVAHAGKKKKALKCPAFASAVEGAEEAELFKVTPKATEEKPVVIEYEHGSAFPGPGQEHLYFNIQVYGPASGLYIRQEFDNQSDIDLYLYDAAGEEVASSGAFNFAPVGPFSSDGNGGSGYESINGFPVETCDGFTIDSDAYATFGTAATLKIWFGEVVEPEE